MKYVVFSDVHGVLSGAEAMTDIVKKEKPNKVVICGDLYGYNFDAKPQIGKIISQLDAVVYLVKGNGDFDRDAVFSGIDYEDYCVFYDFGRTLFFTHGHVYNQMIIPPFLKENDLIVFGHTHVGRLGNSRGLLYANVGSMGLPRGGAPGSYLTIDESGVTLLDLQGQVLAKLPF